MAIAARDITTDEFLAEDLHFATSWWQRLRGLMFRRSLNAGEGLFIEPCSSIHMMFVPFSLDAVFVDKDHRVVKVSRGVRPWIGLGFGGRGARGVIEVAAGAAERVLAGHQLDFSSPAQPAGTGRSPQPPI